MLAYGLTGTTEASGSTTTNPASLDPRAHPGQQTPNLHTPWRGTTGAAGLLTCRDTGWIWSGWRDPSLPVACATGGSSRIRGTRENR